MTQHQTIIVCELLCTHLNDIIKKRKVTEQVLHENIQILVLNLKSGQHTSLDDYTECYINWDNHVQNLERHFVETNNLAVTKRQLEIYSQELKEQYTS